MTAFRTAHRLGIARIVLLLLLSAFALSSFASTTSYAGLNHIQNIINNTPGVTLANMGSGMAATSTGGVTVTTSTGMRIPVPVTATATVSKATLATNAARVIRGAGIVGAAFTAYEVYDWVKNSGVSTCPPPNFFCKAPTVVEDPTNSAYVWRASYSANNYTSPTEACQKPVAAIFGEGAVGILGAKVSDTWYQCTIWKNGSGSTYQVNRYACQYALTNGQCLPPTQEATQPFANDQALADAIAASSGWPSADTVKLYKAIRNDAAKTPELIPAAELMPAATPVTISAPPVTTAPTVVKTEVKVQPDGSTVTVETSEQIKVIPNIPWPRVGDAATVAPTFKEEKTTTTTNISPAGVRTPVSTTTETPATTTEPEKAAADGPIECGSPGRPKCQIDETGMPEAETMDKVKDLKTIEDANTARNTEWGKINEQTSGINKGWFPTIPTTACVNPRVPVPITSAMLEIPICPGVDAFRALFGLVVAFFVVMGSISQIQQAIKA